MRSDLLINEFFPEVNQIQKEQIKKLDDLMHQRDSKEDIVLLYFFHQTESAWEDINFSLRLLTYNETKHFALPIRSIFNKVIKLIYLTFQTEEKRKEICRKDFLQISSLFYKISETEEQKKVYSQSFKDFNTIGLNISDRIIAFPDMKSMIRKVFPTEVDSLYFLYSDLSEFVHGNIIFSFREDNYFPAGLDIIARLSFELIKVCDWHLNGGTLSQEVLEFKKKWESKIED